MHILLGLLASTVTILWLLHRLADMGMNFGGLNPFAWRRRRNWHRNFEANPIFSLSDPREIAAVLLTGIAKIDGDLSASEKRSLLEEFERSFSMRPRTASELLSSTVFMLGDMQVVITQAKDLIDRYREHLDSDQIQSMLEMIGRIAALDGGPTGQQSELADLIRSGLQPSSDSGGTWAPR